jgi:hypothetical protein
MKSGRSLTDSSITLWPYSVVARWIWSLSSFPNDNAWPDTFAGMVSCTTLNIGLFIWVLFGLTLILLNADLVTAFVESHYILGYDVQRAWIRGLDLTYEDPVIEM